PDLLDVPRALSDDRRFVQLDFGGNRCDLGEIGALTPPDDAFVGLDAADQAVVSGEVPLAIAPEAHDHRLDLDDLELSLFHRPRLIQDGVRVRSGPRADGAVAAAG